jgi:hypothetical protein
MVQHAMATERHSIMVEQCRKLIGLPQFKNEPQRILLAALAFIASTLQKHLFRELKPAVTATENKESLSVGGTFRGCRI